MLLFPVWVSVLLGLLAGFLPLLGTEPLGGSKGTTSPQQPPSCDSNCSQLTLKLEFSTKVVEDGKTGVLPVLCPPEVVRSEEE